MPDPGHIHDMGAVYRLSESRQGDELSVLMSGRQHGGLFAFRYIPISKGERLCQGRMMRPPALAGVFAEAVLNCRAGNSGLHQQ